LIIYYNRALGGPIPGDSEETPMTSRDRRAELEQLLAEQRRVLEG